MALCLHIDNMMIKALKISRKRFGSKRIRFSSPSTMGSDSIKMFFNFASLLSTDADAPLLDQK